MRQILPLVLVLACASTASAAPRWLRLSWTGATDTTMSVTWTDDSAGAGAVEYRVPGGAVASVSSTAIGTGAGELGTTYTARLEGLSPATAYDYRVLSGGQWSAWGAFRTAPKRGSCDPVRFVAGGDSRGEELWLVGYRPSAQWGDIAKRMAGEEPHFAIHSGDIVRAGDAAKQWEKEMPLIEGLSRAVPFFMIIGNHDDGPGQGAGARFNALFETPANGPDHVDDYWSFVAGNVLVVGLSTYTYSMDAQIDWLRTQLETHREGIDWRIVTFHTPVWSSGNHGDNEDDKTRAAKLVPLLDEYAVDLVLNGHDHDYERFHPSRGGWGGVPRQITPLAGDGGRRGTAQGTTYIVTGGAGALVNPVFAAKTGAALGSNKLHYVSGEARGGTLTLNVRDCGTQSPLSGAKCDGGSLETIVLEKSATSCAAPVEPVDAGTPDPVDAGGEDASVPDASEPADASDPPDASDAGEPIDASDPVDASVPDASVEPADAGAKPSSDAGPELAPSGGCECASVPLALFPALLLVPLSLRRRRASPRA